MASPRQLARSLLARLLSPILIAALLVSLAPLPRAQASIQAPASSGALKSLALPDLAAHAPVSEEEVLVCVVVIAVADPPWLTKSAFGELLAHTGSDPQPYAFAGEPLDPNAGFQYHRARWMDPRAGRFVGMDPFEDIETTPATLHRYLYVAADPVNALDPSGLFSTGTHNQILDKAFPSVRAVSQEDLRTFKTMSARQDDFLSGQGGDVAYQHAMRGPNQSIEQAKGLYEKFIGGSLTEAVRLEQIGGHSVAMEVLGASLHGIADSSSPVHKGFQLWDPTNVFSWRLHHNGEENPPQWAIDDAITGVKAHYNDFRRRLLPSYTLFGSGMSGFAAFSGTLIAFASFTAFF